MSVSSRLAALCLGFGLALAQAGGAAGADLAGPAPIDPYRLAHGFVGETWDATGRNTGFSAPNPWGQYTAYWMSTNARGQRTWRIEHYLPSPNGPTAQGSSVYLLEGRDRALLIDTANPAAETEGVNDLKTLVRHLLAHRDDGSPKPDPLDFVVANTHSHGDHTGENARMADRTVYYMDLDWPANAPANYVPIREGGGPARRGPGMAAGEIELGLRTIRAVALPPHTPGSTGYLDGENQMLFTGDALGTGFVWLHFPGAALTTYRESLRRLTDLTAPYPRLAAFGAHFYQYRLGERARPPVNGRIADRQYIADQSTLVAGILAGRVEGEPYNAQPYAFIATHGAAQIVYSLSGLTGPGEAAGAPFHAVRLPGANPPAALAGLKAELHVIRGPGGEAYYLLKGSARSALIGAAPTGTDLQRFVRPLAGSLPMDIVPTSSGPARPGGIDLGLDLAGRPLRLEVHPFGPEGRRTLVEPVNRLAFVGEALGPADLAAGWTPPGGAAAYAAALARWRAATDGRYDLVYTGDRLAYATPASLAGTLAQAAAEAVQAGRDRLVVAPPGRR